LGFPAFEPLVTVSATINGSCGLYRTRLQRGVSFYVVICYMHCVAMWWFCDVHNTSRGYIGRACWRLVCPCSGEKASL